MHSDVDVVHLGEADLLVDEGALVLEAAQDKIAIVPLAFGMTSYTVGPILAIFLAAMWGRGSIRGLGMPAIPQCLAAAWAESHSRR